MQPLLAKTLTSLERLGNRLPEPATLFVMLIAVVAIASALVAWLDLSVIHPGTQDQIVANNLFSAAQIRRLLTEMPQIFAGFPPLGLVLVVMLGIGVADKTGFITTLLRLFISRVPRRLLSAALVFTGIMSSLAADAGYVFLIPIGAVLFNSAGRHPLAGLAAAFAGVSAGFSANLLLTALDPLLAGLTESAAHIIQPSYQVNIAANYYLMIALVPILTIVGAWLTDKVVEPRLSIYSVLVTEQNTATNDMTSLELRGLIVALVSIAVLLIILAFLVVPQNAILRAVDGGLQPFYRSLIALMFILFFIPGLLFGIVTKKVRNDKDVVDMTASSMADMAHYIVLAFLAAHFIALFKWSNLGLMLAISGASFLQGLNFTGLPLIVSFILVAASINLFVGSASAKWAVMAPVFVPMLMLLGYSPELTQAAYRVGDSFTNVLTPLLPYFPLVIIFARKYSADFGIGSLVVMMLPYSVGFGCVSTLLLIIWMMSGWMLGPETSLYISSTL